MPCMPRPRSKATKIAHNITGVPANMKGYKQNIPASRPEYGFTYGHKLVGTILRGGGS
jgi:hypothetical protein